MENTQGSMNRYKKLSLIPIAILIIMATISVIYMAVALRENKILIQKLMDENKALSMPRPNPCEITPEKLQIVITKLQPKLDPLLAKEISSVIVSQCKLKNMDPALVAGLIFVESVFDPFAESNRNAVGLMQVRYSVWKEEPELKGDGVHAKGALFWIDKNIAAGVNILNKYYQESGCDMRKTLYRYNTGAASFPAGSWNIEYVNKVIYYTYWVKTQLNEENKCTVETVEPVIEEEKSTVIEKEAKNG